MTTSDTFAPMPVRERYGYYVDSRQTNRHTLSGALTITNINLWVVIINVFSILLP